MQKGAKKISILGSTGSIGKSTLDVVKRSEGHLEVIGLATGASWETLGAQAREFSPKIISCFCPAPKLAASIEKLNPRPEIYFGAEGNAAVASLLEAELVVMAMVGSVGLAPTMKAVALGKNIAFANKEVLVSAGELVMDKAKETGAKLIPIDSEHNAIFQCLQGQRSKDVARIILTASGGPFRDFNFEQLKSVTKEEALKHPNWDMGNQITIDSATMMNKGLEVIEARWLFGLHPDQIDILVHPESIIHSIVEFKDGSMLALLSEHDMRIPIGYALYYPERLHLSFQKLDLEKVKQLNFAKPNPQLFKALTLAREAANAKTSMATVLNAANEMARNAFLQDHISFLDIAETVEKVMNAHIPTDVQDIAQIGEIDAWARMHAQKIMSPV
jgi:1-deoxy-D-xylulose-5-phosphate reductoisomerase